MYTNVHTHTHTHKPTLTAYLSRRRAPNLEHKVLFQVSEGIREDLNIHNGIVLAIEIVVQRHMYGLLQLPCIRTLRGHVNRSVLMRMMSV
jgi:hypothetical protein